MYILNRTKQNNIYLRKDMSIKGNGRRYYQEYKNIIVGLFKSGMSLSELSSEYGITKSTINDWIKDLKELCK